MHKLKFSAITIALTLGLVGCSEAPQQTSTTSTIEQQSTIEQASLNSGIDLKYIDKNIRPQDNFYLYMNGKWLEETKIPADKSSYGSFTKLYDDSLVALKEILENTAKLENPKQGSDEQKLGDFYTSFTDELAREELGTTPLEPYLAQINAVKDNSQLPALFAQMQLSGTKAPLGWYVYNDAKDSDKNVFYLFQAGLGLPDRDYYLTDNNKFTDIKKAYTHYIAALLAKVGHHNPKQGAENVMQLESALAAIQWSRVDSRDATKTYNKLNVSEFDGKVKSFSLANYFEALGADISEVVIQQPSYLEGLSQVIDSHGTQVWKDYFTFHFSNGYANLLSKDVVDLQFEFFGKTLRGVESPSPNWKKAVNASNTVLGELLGKVYVKEYFPPEAKKRMEVLVDNLILGFEQSIEALEWMSDETKRAAKEKLSKFTPKIGYPDKWKDYSGLEINPDELVGNYVRYNRWMADDSLSRLSKPVDRSEWLMTPQTVNAYYNPLNNEIVFPAAILQPPFFDLEADDAVNYGGIGAVIGHELGHGFDDQGAKYDGDGNLRNWWSDSDLQHFKAKGDKLIAQYNQFQPFPDANVNGQLTLGENIGDLGGLTVAYRAYQLSLNGKTSPVIDDFTGEQRIFMGWAQIWRNKYREAELRNRLMTDSHSPTQYRVEGVLPNMPEFYQAFDVKPSDKMYIKPEERVKIW